MRLLDDVRLAVRALGRAPLFALVSIGSLAVGIGANVTVFSLANTLLLRPLPVPAADRLVRVGRTTPGTRFGAVSYREYRDLAAAVAPNAELIAHAPNSAILTAADGPKPAWLELVSPNYFAVLGVRPIFGRAFAAGDGGARDAGPNLIISHRLWGQRFGSDSSVIGKGVRLNGRPFTIIGVAPAGFLGTFTGFAIDGWVPVSMQPIVAPSSGSIDQRDDRFLMMIAARRSGADDAALAATLAVVAKRLQEAQRNPRDAVRLELAGAGGVHPFVAGLVRAFVGLLQAIVLLVLVIACVNLANVMLVRASARQRALAVRAALGASRWRLAELTLAEVLVVAVCGGALGTALAAIAARALDFVDLPVGLPLGLTLDLDATVLTAAIAVTTMTAFVFGVGPAVAASRASVLASLRVGGATTDRRRSRVRSFLVGTQVAIATVLLVGSGLAIRSLRESALLDPGFSQARVHVLSASPDLLGYDEARGRALWEDIVTRVSGVPGVESASLALFVPLGARGDQLNVAPEGKRDAQRPFAYNFVRPGYFGMLGISLIAGRDFAPNDDRRAPDVAVVSRAMARRFFGDSNAVGRTIRIEERGGNARNATIIGVARDIKLRSMGEAAAPIAYLPFGQWYRPDMVLHIRVSENTDQVLPRVVEQIREAEPNLALEIQSMARATEFSMIPLRVAGTVLGFCGVVGVLLAALGVFGLVAYAVSLRMREIGIRVALGAGRTALTRLVAIQALRPVGIGLMVGLVISAGLGRVIRGLLVGVRPVDPVSFGAAAAVLLAAGVVAIVQPLRRALAIEPAVVLRSE